MAIKLSNQITFIEQKKIVELKEWYLATDRDTGVTIETEGWTTEIQTITETKKYLWNYEEVVYSIGSSDISDPIIIGTYGGTGSSLQVKYMNSADIPNIVDNDVSEWSDVVPPAESGKKLYMIQKMSTDVNWSVPIQLSAEDGAAANVEIIDGYWYINGESTGIKAQGENGSTPAITIGENGNWFIDGKDSGNKAQGEAGKDGTFIEYVYYRSMESLELSAPSYVDGVLTDGWTVSPQGITEEYRYEYVSVRNKPSGGNWGEFSAPVIWSKWGEKGQDGDGVEYKYYLSNSDVAPIYSIDDSSWTDDPQGVSKDKQYEYVVQIKTINGASSASSPSLWAKFSEDGVGISSIKNYYLSTQESELPPPTERAWKEVADTLSPTNKYLWNYEVIIYTDSSTTETDPAIIGVYGDSGATTVDFQIYSVDGFEFNDHVNKIELKTVAFQAGKAIENASYCWKRWNAEDNTYTTIDGATFSTFTVNSTGAYTEASIKCEMTYGGIVYEDYVSLTKATDVYTATIKFLNGSNVIATGKNYLIAYAELYKNNAPEELLQSDKVYVSSRNSMQNGIISTDISSIEKVEGSMVYFVLNERDVVLGKYASNTWTVVQNNYTYRNSLFSNATSPVIYIPKGKIPKALCIDCEISKDDVVVARTNAMVMDLNDPLVGNSPPSDPQKGQLWLDTSISPSLLKMWDGAAWVNSGYQSGNVVYTSKPQNGYSEGDLWILADGEQCGDYGAGSMLRAIVTSSTFNAGHWKDVMEENTAVLNNVKQYFLFNANTGLRIGQSGDDFYVNIDAKEMGFYDASDGSAKKVVSIGNKSATIKGLTVQEGATFECEAKFNNEVRFGNFIWKTESDGGLSLILAT